MRGSLTARVVAATTLLVVIVAAIFVVLLVAIGRQHDAAAQSRHSQEVLVAASALERHLIDLEAGERGFVITHDETFLEPWTAAMKAIPPASRQVLRLTTMRDQEARARHITDGVASYVREYSVPTVDEVRRDEAPGGDAATIADGERRIEALRAQFEGLVEAETALAAARGQQADDAARIAIITASLGFVGCVVLIILYATYLTRAIVRPISRAATMAEELAAGDLSVRMPETGAAGIGALEHSFNTMASSLEASSAELAASRARVVAAADAARRRIERDLHDGVQQHLVALALALRAVEHEVPPEQGDLRARLSDAANGLNDTLTELQEISRGIHPAILSKGGLVPALKTLTRRSGLAVELDLQSADRRLPEGVEVAAYYIVAEALTNAAKHANASEVRVGVSAEDALLVLSIHDDGTGGADPGRGSGLIGLRDRVATLGGTIDLTSSSREGTIILAKIPIGGKDDLDG